MDDAGTIDEMESVYNPSSTRKEDLIRAASFSRVVAKSLDFIIVIALLKIIPVVGFFAGLAYLLLADGMFKGRSAGKKLLGLRVIISQERPAEIVESGYRESVFRNFPFAAGYLLAGILWNIPVLGGILSFIIVAAVLVVEYLIMFGSVNDKRLGDEIAQTKVIIDKQGGINVS